MFTAPAVNFTATLTGAPNGNAGNHYTVQTMRQLVQAGKVDPVMINAAVGLINGQPQHDQLAEVRALFEYVRDRIRYVQDVAGVETLASPQMTLQRQVGDCDDQATLLATLFEAVGYPTRFVMAGYSGQDFEHVYLQVMAGGFWINCDPTERVPLGWYAPDPLCLWIEKV